MKHAGLRVIAVFEAAKGLLVLAAGAGLHALAGRDVQALTERLIAHMHFNPASRYPQIFLNVADRLSNAHLQLLAAGAALYAGVRLVEAYGLWRERRWGEWLGVLAAGLYVPVELFELTRGVTGLKLALLGANLLIVGYLAAVLKFRGASA